MNLKTRKTSSRREKHYEIQQKNYNQIFYLRIYDLSSSLDNIKAPSSVKAYGKDFLGRFVLDVITNCDEIRLHSCSVNWNIKSSGKRLALRLTVWFRDRVSTSYSMARSKSSMTRCPRMTYMRFCIFCNSSIVHGFNVTFMICGYKGTAKRAKRQINRGLF